MKILKDSRRNFQFTIDEEYEDKDDGSVKITDGVLYFAKSKFSSMEECETWWAENEDDFKPKFAPGKKLKKKIQWVENKVAGVTDAEWAKIKALMTRPDGFSKEDVAVYHPIVAHNLYDRDDESFTKNNVLTGFVKTAPGKPVLIAHYHGPPGEGRIFDAKLVKIEDPEATFGPLPKDVKKQIPKIIERDGGIYGLETPFYMLVDDYMFIRKIDAGIIKDMSIGFAASAKEPIKDKDGNTVFWDFTGDGDFMEVSFVWLGAQYGAQNRKDFNANKPDASDDNPPNSEGSQKDAALKDPSKKKENIMNLNFKSLDLEIESDSPEELQSAVDEKVSEILDRENAANDKLKNAQDELETTQAELKTLKDAIGDDDLQKLKDTAKAHRDGLIEEAVKYGSLIGLIEKDQVDEKRKAFGSMTDDALQSMIVDYQKIHDARNPGKEILADGDGNDEEPAELMSLDARYETI